MDILEMLTKSLGSSNVLDSLSETIGADKKQVASATSMLVPTLLNGLTKNAQSANGLTSLFGALDKHKDSNVSDVSQFLQNVDLTDGKKIISHILGSKTATVTKEVSKESGLSTKQATTLLSTLGPLVMGTLGNQKSKNQLDAGALLTMLTGSKGMMDTVTNLLDADKDGSIIDDLGDLVGKFLKK